MKLRQDKSNDVAAVESAHYYLISQGIAEAAMALREVRLSHCQRQKLYMKRFSQCLPTPRAFSTTEIAPPDSEFEEAIRQGGRAARSVVAQR
ncbi:MAG: hypothetical protein HZB28_07070 [Methylocystis sp.]|nr:hypothetical protein [Methylocystis sp.]